MKWSRDGSWPIKCLGFCSCLQILLRKRPVLLSAELGVDLFKLLLGHIYRVPQKESDWSEFRQRARNGDVASNNNTLS
jgi:hypothetical protein